MTTYWLNGEHSPPPTIQKEDVPQITTSHDFDEAPPPAAGSKSRAVVIDETRSSKNLPNGDDIKADDADSTPLGKCNASETEPLTGNGTPHVV